MTTAQLIAAVQTPSRALNLDLSKARVEQLCAKHDVAISVIEPLPEGGTRVVLMNISGADVLRGVCSGKLLARDALRTPFFRHR
jgi:hypothetical protein